MSHFNVLIIGAGAAGISIAARIAHLRPKLKIGIIDPSEKHYYQPLFTLVGGGACSLAETIRHTSELIPPHVQWLKERALTIDPKSHEVTTEHSRVQYDSLVVATGLRLAIERIPGLQEALDQGIVCTNYSELYVENTWKQLQAFRGGTAVFTVPATPIKCGGAPQKIMYLADDIFRRNGVRNKTKIFYTSALEKIFPAKKYAASLEKVIARRDIEVKFRHELIAIDIEQRRASFKLGGEAMAEIDFDFMHVTPPMMPQPFLLNSPLCNPSGWVQVDRQTLQNPTFPDVFALGDASDLPTSKTAAAIRKQAPILVHNLLAHLEGKALDALYNGYTSCPLVTGYGKLILAEFDYDGNPCETFPFDQGKERTSMYLLKKYALPQLYWHGMLTGRA